MGTENVHGVIRQMTLAAGYKTSVNEPETMTDAKMIDGQFCLQSGACGLRRRSGRFALVAAVARNIERS